MHDSRTKRTTPPVSNADRIVDLQTLNSFCNVPADQLGLLEGGFGGGFNMGWGGGSGGQYDGTSWETDIDGMCYIDGRYY